jgi:hypothetical protein
MAFGPSDRIGRIKNGTLVSRGRAAVDRT